MMPLCENNMLKSILLLLSFVIWRWAGPVLKNRQLAWASKLPEAVSLATLSLLFILPEIELNSNNILLVAAADFNSQNNVQDAFVIAVEQQARERLERLSALKRIKPVDMTKLSHQVRNTHRSIKEIRSVLNGNETTLPTDVDFPLMVSYWIFSLAQRFALFCWICSWFVSK